MTKIKLVICIFIAYPINMSCMEKIDNFLVKIGFLDPIDHEEENICEKPQKKDTVARKIKKREIRIEKILMDPSIPVTHRHISTIPHYEQLVKLSEENNEISRSQYYQQKLNKLHKLKIRVETRELIEKLKMNDDRINLCKAYAIMRDSYDTQEKKSEYQNLITQIQAESEEELRLQAIEINRQCMITGLTAEIMTVNQNDQLPAPVRLDKLASLLQKRAFIYSQNRDVYQSEYDQDNKKAREFRLQLIALEKDPVKQTIMLKALQS